MLSRDQILFFETNGYLVVEDVLDQAGLIDPIRKEYSAIIDGLYEDWYVQGKVCVAPDGLDFDGKLLEAYRCGCDWFQPIDIHRWSGDAPSCA